jgi:hypothetical protein
MKSIGKVDVPQEAFMAVLKLEKEVIWSCLHVSCSIVWNCKYYWENMMYYLVIIWSKCYYWFLAHRKFWIIDSLGPEKVEVFGHVSVKPLIYTQLVQTYEPIRFYITIWDMIKMIKNNDKINLFICLFIYCKFATSVGPMDNNFYL